MGDFNKIFSFVLGLLVVVIILAIVTKRFNLGNRVRILRSEVLTPTPTPFDTIEIAGGKVAGDSTTQPSPSQKEYTGPTPTQMPKTGPEEFLLLFSVSSAAAGIYLRRKI